MRMDRRTDRHKEANGSFSQFCECSQKHSAEDENRHTLSWTTKNLRDLGTEIAM